LGLRTLAVAVRCFTQNEYQDVDSLFQAASQCLLDREGEMGRAFDSIETGMTLLGATAVEDQLQEQVPETLEALRAAGIKVTEVISPNIQLTTFKFY
jgi:magnesium-transporting ATPase (P-type)